MQVRMARLSTFWRVAAATQLRQRCCLNCGDALLCTPARPQVVAGLLRDAQRAASMLPHARLACIMRGTCSDSERAAKVHTVRTRAAGSRRLHTAVSACPLHNMPP
ncbi:hypothetical protein EON67_08400 [archaeon]|nr:MAG: hypothetical protein EON67_08400 [archaeon]